MANIDIFIKQINGAIYGSEARKPIEEAFWSLNTESEELLNMAENLQMPKIVVQPRSQSVIYTASAIVEFSVIATQAESYQWQYSADGGTTWSDNTADGNDSSTFSFHPVRSWNGRMYRCKVSNEYGYIYTDEVTLTVT